MASNEREVADHQTPAPKLQIYPTSCTEISPFWKEKYERDAKKYWDIFYKRHQDRFFKDRHYLDKEWGRYFDGPGQKFVLEVGCGAGNTIFPLVATYPNIFVHACDFSPRAIDLVKAHKDFTEERVSGFVCDLTLDDLSEQISSSSVDIVTMIFVLSAVSPEKMPLVLQNIKRILKPNGRVMFRDYAIGDLAQERFTSKDQKISENFYVRGDGTRAFYFSEEFLKILFKESGFDVEELALCCKQVENRSRELVMNRRWIQAVFCFSDAVKCQFITESGDNVDFLHEGIDEPKLHNGNASNQLESFEIDMSDSVAADMFGISPSVDEIVEVNLKGCCFRIKGLSKEYQHTCKSTGLMLWEAARLLAAILAGNPSIVAEKRVLELGCGCAGICSMVAAKSAELVVATDGDTMALDLLSQNVNSNLKPDFRHKLIMQRLEWGTVDHIDAIKKLNPKGFDVIIGTDVTYIPEAVSPLFATAKELISSNQGMKEDQKAALVLCHVFRRVDESSILSAASHFGFNLVDRWTAGKPISSSQGTISSWFLECNFEEYLPSTALNIMYFHPL